MRRALVFSVVIASVAVGAAPARGSLAWPLREASTQCKGGWMNAKPPAVGNPTALRSVAAVSDSDVWAVGDMNGFSTLAIHFDGTSWSIVPTPSPGLSQLFGVAGASSDDVWAVGVGGTNGTLALHWEGSAWSSVPTPSPGPSGGNLYDVAVLAPDDVWAVGLAFGSSEGESSTLTEHWDGSTWTIVPSPSVAPNSFFTAVSAVSASDAWAIGLAEVDHWDGSAWNLVATPQSFTKLMSDVAAFGPDDVWVTGWTLAGGTQPYFAHWDGTRWKDTTGPPIPEWGQIMGIGGPSTRRLWAVGSQPQGLLMERWDGASWHVVPAPSPQGVAPAELMDVVVDSDGRGWTVGTRGNRDGDPLVERTCRH